MAAPTVTECMIYLGSDSAWDELTVTSAFDAEKAAQAGACTVPADDATWPADLIEALFRRVAHNLAVRALPLGVQASISEAAIATTRVGGTDAEVRRLELPYKRRFLG